ncbi:MAG: hypothetical protein IJS09_02415 [Treponema sp.]|nr:hypothetical protein [Treponema sp.]
MKKILAAVSTFLLIGAIAFAEGSFLANDLETSESVTEAIALNGFTVNASKDKDVRVKNTSKVAPDGKSFKKCLDLRGKQSNGARTIKFSAKKGETVTVYGNSGSKTDDRTILVQTAKKKTILKVPVKIYTGEISMGEVKIPEDGDYQVCSEDKGVYVYGIIVK